MKLQETVHESRHQGIIVTPSIPNQPLTSLPLRTNWTAQKRGDRRWTENTRIKGSKYVHVHVKGRRYRSLYSCITVIFFSSISWAILAMSSTWLGHRSSQSERQVRNWDFTLAFSHDAWIIQVIQRSLKLYETNVLHLLLDLLSNHGNGRVC